MTLPLRANGTTVTLLSETQDAFGDKTWTDGTTIDGCMYFPSYSNSGRITWRAENTSGGQDVVTETRTLYMPYDTVVDTTMRVLIHPDGVEDPAQIDAATRRENTYDILGEPMFWKNQLTGWAPVCELALLRVS